ncbi:hypothetical protein TNCV_384761 [Trichonephila clavipes]|nr:hypothetical protein TNCV_384761 [Trichonephila clavipes]
MANMFFPYIALAGDATVAHDVRYNDESRYCLQHQDSRIRVWWNRGERTLSSCIRHCHTGTSRDSKGIILDARLGHLLFALTTLT